MYELWSDDDHALAVYYDAAVSASIWVPDRLTVVLDGDGNQWLEYPVGLGISTHPSEVLADCEAMFGP